MKDIEKIINGLKALDDSMHENQCYACSHEFIEAVGQFGTVILAEAEEELKRNIPQEIEVEGGGSSWWNVCPECHGAIDRSDRFCRHCGQAVTNETKRTEGKI